MEDNIVASVLHRDDTEIKRCPFWIAYRKLLFPWVSKARQSAEPALSSQHGLPIRCRTGFQAAGNGLFGAIGPPGPRIRPFGNERDILTVVR